MPVSFQALYSPGSLILGTPYIFFLLLPIIAVKPFFGKSRYIYTYPGDTLRPCLDFPYLAFRSLRRLELRRKIACHSLDYSLLVSALIKQVYEIECGTGFLGYPAEVSEISGFYSPGAFTAWYLRAVIASEKHLRYKPSGSSTSSSRRKVGGDLLTTLTYPPSAIVDITW